MLIYIVLLTVITQTISLHTGHCHNRVVRRKMEYRVNISIPDDDIEMTDTDKLIQFSNTAIRYSKRTHKQPHRTSQTRHLVGKYNITTMYPQVTKPVQNLSQIEPISARSDTNLSLTKNSYRDAKREEKSEETVHTVEIDGEKGEIEEQTNQRIVREISADRIWKIVQIWLIIYFVLAVPLWFTIGRCCCCLVCKCFRAQETIREAKQYAMWNPPGILRKKSGDVIYTPSDKEKEAYEELEHLIRTL